MNQLTLMTNTINMFNVYCNLLIEQIPLLVIIYYILQLLTELTRITLPTGQQFPLPLTQANIYAYFDIIKLRVVYINENLFLPYIYHQQMSISIHCTNFYLFIFPIIPSNLYSYIVPSQPYLLISNTKVPLRELDESTLVDDGNPNCYELLPTRIPEKPICETTLMTSDITKIPPTCTTKTIHAIIMEAWHPLHDNRCLYILSEPTLMTTTCTHDTMDNITLQHTGILEISPGSKGCTHYHVITASTNFNKTFLHPTPNYNIATDDCCLQHVS